MPRHRFMVPGEGVYETENLARARKAHPDAVVTHTVKADEAGNAVLVPFTGKATDDDATPVTDATTTTTLSPKTTVKTESAKKR